MWRRVKPRVKKNLRFLSKTRLKYMTASIGFLILLDVFGAFTHMFEVSYNENFIYPYHGRVQPFIEALRHRRKPEVEPINVYDYSYVRNATDKCVDPDFRKLHLVFLVKSAVEHFERRQAIRNSWGFGKRFFDIPTRLIFLLGTNPWDQELQRSVNAESEKHRDILQADFVDSYYNNTIKTMMGFKWAMEHCANSKFYMFLDDDIYVSVKNVLRFLRNPTYYPNYLKEPSRMVAKRETKDSDWQTDSSDAETLEQENEFRAPVTKIFERAPAGEKIETRGRTARKPDDESRMLFSPAPENNSQSSTRSSGKVNESATLLPESFGNETHPKNKLKRGKRQVFDLELPDDVKLFAGYVFVSSPHRHKTSKWYVPLKEYPYNMWPPYVTAGAYVLSKEALIDMYYASLYTKHFKFDDIFLGIVAKKADIEPFHCDEFHFYKKEYTKYNYKYVISSHGYDDPKELLAVWQEQKALGNA